MITKSRRAVYGFCPPAAIARVELDKAERKFLAVERSPKSNALPIVAISI